MTDHGWPEEGCSRHAVRRRQMLCLPVTSSYEGCHHVQHHTGGWPWARTTAAGKTEVVGQIARCSAVQALVNQCRQLESGWSLRLLTDLQAHIWSYWTDARSRLTRGCYVIVRPSDFILQSLIRRTDHRPSRFMSMAYTINDAPFPGHCLLSALYCWAPR